MDAEIVRCKECKHQRKTWHADKLYKSGGYYLVGCEKNGDPFVEHAVYGFDMEYCSNGERKDEID